MLSKSNKALKNICAVFLIMSLMVLSFIPAFAEAEPMPLSEENVVTSPTVEGTIYPEQRIGDYLTITGGKVTTDGTENGTVISGSWEFIDPDYIPTVSAQKGIDIRFVPDNSDLYTSFEMRIFYTVSSFPLEIDGAMPIVDVTSGIRFNKITTLSSVKFKNGLTGEAVNDAYYLTWANSRQTVTKTGYYSVTIAIPPNYQTLSTFVYVRVDGDQSEPAISEFPTVDPITYRDGLKASDLTIHAEATSGSFKLSNPEQELKSGNNSVEVVWQPDEAEQEPISISLYVYVEEATASFIDENGEPIIPEVKFLATQEDFRGKDIINQLEKFDANCGKAGEMVFDGGRYSFQIPQAFTRLSAGDNSGSNSWKIPEDFDANGYVCSVTLKSNYNTNYTSIIKFKIVQVKKLVTPQISWFKDEMTIRGLVYTDYPAGTFKVYANGELIESTKDGVKYLTSFAWRPAKSGTYNIKAEYTPAENDKVAIENNVIEQDVTANLSWTVNGENVNFTSTTKQYGTNVTVLQSLGDNFGGWEFYDENGNKYADPEKELGMRYDPTVPSTVNFTMPDHDVTVKAIDKTQVELPGGDSKLPDFFSKIINWINNLITKIKALFDAIIQSLMLIG